MASERAWDVIVVGAGSAGCVVAARLAADPARRVLLVEAGGEATSPWIALPVGYARLLSDRDLTWGYRTDPEPALGGRVLDAPAGRVIGGTGSLNGMLHVRGHPADYDGWRDAGNEGWGHDDVLPWFRRIEACAHGEAAWHGRDGPLPVARPAPVDALSRAFVAAAIEAGAPPNDDFNGATQEGAGCYAVNIARGRRASSATAYLAPARRLPNLDVRTRTRVDRVVIEDGRAVAIDVHAHGGPARWHAREAIVLCAGTFNSPALLLRSGVGDPAALHALGIAPRVPLPGVGSGLQNHYRAGLVLRIAGLPTLNERASGALGRLALGLRWVATRGGPFAVGTAAGAFLRSSAAATRPDLQFVFWNYSVARRGADGLELHRHPGCTINAVVLRPASRGEVRLASADPAVPPRIVYRHLAEQADRATLAAGLALAREIAAQPALARHVVEELAPGPAVRGEAALAAWGAAHGGSVYHPVGTCRMGRDPRAVVDARLRVHGVDGLVVADASVMPTLPAGNTNAPTLMIAERAAAWIAGGAG